MRLYNQVYQKIGIDYGIVNSIDGYDEISLTSDFKVTTNDYERIFKPQDLGFETAKPEEVRGGATEEEAKDIFDAVLETEHFLPRRISFGKCSLWYPGDGEGQEEH